MWTKRKMAGIILMAMILTGCSKGLTAVEKAEYQRMLGVKASMNLEIDTEKYQEAVLYILSDKVVITEELVGTIGEYQEYFTENMVSSLKLKSEKAIDTEDTIDTVVEGNEIPGGEDLWEEWEGEPLEDEWEAYEEDGMYPIYDRYFSVVSYGTKEEMIASIEDFKGLPVNEIKSATVYPEMIVYRVINKFQGEIAVVVKLIEGKIDSYEVFR